MTEKSQIKNLQELADYFKILANDQIGSKRWQRTAKAKAECQLKADTYLDAAKIVEGCELETPK